MHRSCLIAVCLLVHTHLSSRCGFADDETLAANALIPENVITWSQMTVRIVDPDGKPLHNATVQPWALRAGNGHGVWNQKKYGVPSLTITDTEGKTVVTFPEQNEWSHNDKHPVTQVSLDVRHADFCAKNVHTDVPKQDAATVQDIYLERGTKLRVAGVKPGTEQPLSDCYLMFEGQQSIGNEFQRESSGWLQSIPVKDNQRWYQVVRMAPGEQPEFSLPQAWNPDDPASLSKTVAVHPGIRVTGQIADNVPRPIRRGYVVVRCGSPARPDEEGNRKENKPVWWMNYTQIAEDGSFEFSSLPAGTLGQFYAYANDFISAQPTDEAYDACHKWFGLTAQDRHQVFRYGQVLRIFKGQPQLTIEMELAGQVRVKCTDMAGNPLKGVGVSSWPNQYMIAAGSTIFCGRYASSEFLRKDFRFTGDDHLKRSPYYDETDDQGTVMIQSLPSGKQGVFAENEHWGLKDGEVGFTSEPGKTAELTIQLERIH